MSYDVELIDRKTKETVKLQTPLFLRSANMPAMLDDVTGQLVQIPQTEACMNITYNYSSYFYEVTEGDEDFAIHEDVDGKDLVSYGLRGLYGKTALESIPLLSRMIQRIRDKYTDENGDWKKAIRSRYHFYDHDGDEVDLMTASLIGTADKSVEEKYWVSEGDISNYWEQTAANAIVSLMYMQQIAVSCCLMDCEWTGD